MALTQVQGGMLAGSTNTTTTIQSNGTTAITIDSSQNVGIGTSSPSYKLDVQSGTARIYNSTFPSLRIQNSATGTNSNDGLLVEMSGSDALFVNYESANMIFKTADTERMRIDSVGTICMGTTNGDPSGTGVNGLAYVTSAAALTANRSGNACFFLGRSTSTGSITIFRYNTADVGNIATNGSNCTYNSTSDYRLKENITPISNALSRVAQLKPVTYTWKKDGSAGEGFIAHELAEVCPEAVTGEKDAVDEEGKPIYQAIDQSVLVATLTAAIQELNAKVEAQAAEIAALKAAP